jgi:transcriptional regulator with XRE-family HTH domain
MFAGVDNPPKTRSRRKEVTVEAALARRIVGGMMRSARENAGVSLLAAAGSAGWNKGHLSRVERGVTRPSRALVSWYDVHFDGDGVLERTWQELDEAVRERRQRSLAQRRGGDGSDAAITIDLPADHHPDDRAEVIHESIPDWWGVAPGSEFEKTWEVKVTGPVPWAGRYLRRLDSAYDALDSPGTLPLPDAATGDVVKVTVPLRCSESPGCYAAYFTVTDEAGRVYLPHGHPLRCVIRVLDA